MRDPESRIAADVSGLDSNKKLVKFFRDAFAEYADPIRREILPATGADADELKWNMYEFYLGDTATELAGGDADGARTLFVKLLDELLDHERANAPKSGAAKKPTKKTAKKRPTPKRPTQTKPAKRRT